MSGPPWTGAAFAYISRRAAVLLLATPSASLRIG